MKMGRLSVIAVLIALLVMSLPVSAKKPNDNPPKHKTIVAVQTVRDAPVMLADGSIIAYVPKGFMFEAHDVRGNPIKVKGASGEIYRVRRQDVKILRRHKVSVERFDDDRLRHLFFEITRITLSARASDPEYWLNMDMTTQRHREDKVRFEIATMIGVSLPELSLMLSFGLSSGWK